MKLTVDIDANSGFCAGVTRAIKKAEEQLEGPEGRLYSLGAIVHNDAELSRLEAKGLVTIDKEDLEDMQDAHGETLLIRAHGEPPATYRKARQVHFKIIDCTCPVVLKLQESIREAYSGIKDGSTDGQIIIFGKIGHAEVLGLVGQAEGNALVVENLKMLEKNYNPIKHGIKEGKKFIAAWCQAASNITAEVLADSGMDILMVDCEHAPSGFETLISQEQAMNGYKAVPFARAPWNDFVQIKKLLDTGMYGILVPYVETKEEAEKAVAAVKYPPFGVRGVAGSTRAAHFGNNSLGYFTKANDEVMVFIAIESQKGIDNLDGILSVEGLDGVFVGPVDLATNLGHLGNPNFPDVQEAISAVEKKVLDSGKVLMALGGDWEGTKKKLDAGAQIVIAMSDTTSLGSMARENVKKFREYCGE